MEALISASLDILILTYDNIFIHRQNVLEQLPALMVKAGVRPPPTYHTKRQR